MMLIRNLKIYAKNNDTTKIGAKMDPKKSAPKYQVMGIWDYTKIVGSTLISAPIPATIKKIIQIMKLRFY